MSFIAAGLGIGSLVVADAATAATLATMATSALAGEAIGAGVGALTNPKDRLKGALMGGVTGAVGGAATAGLGALGGAASGAAETTAADVAEQSVAQGIEQGAGQTVGDEVASNAMSQVVNAGGEVPPMQAPLPNAPVAPPVSPTPVPPAAAAPSTMGDAFTKTIGPKVLSSMPQILQGGPPTYDNSGQKEIDRQTLEGQQFAQGVYAPSSNWQNPSWAPGKAHGGEIRYANKQGGSISLQNGSFIIPADVVSAIGNGSTKAGAKYLDHLFNALTAGPAPKAGSLAKRRAQERHKA